MVYIICNKWKLLQLCGARFCCQFTCSRYHTGCYKYLVYIWMENLRVIIMIRCQQSSGFQLIVESKFHFALLHLCQLFQPMKSKTKTNCNLYAFPHALRQLHVFASNSDWLCRRVIVVCCDWLKSVLWFRFYSTYWKLL